MARVTPYWTITDESGEPDHRGNVYHDRDDCYEGKKIEPANKQSGWNYGSRLHCEICIGLG